MCIHGYALRNCPVIWDECPSQLIIRSGSRIFACADAYPRRPLHSKFDFLNREPKDGRALRRKMNAPTQLPNQSLNPHQESQNSTEGKHVCPFCGTVSLAPE